MSFAIRALQKDEVDTWVAHCTDVFKHDSAAYFVSHLQDDASALEDLNNILVADDDGTIGATVRVVPRRQFIGGQVVSLGGIAEVSTKERYRGRGLASTLLQAAIDGPLASVDISALHTDATRLGGFYGKFGYIPMPLKTASFPMELPLPPLPPSIRLSPISAVADHAPALHGLYHAVSSAFNGPIHRTIPYFCRWIVSRHRRDHIQAAGAWNEEGKLVGYVFGKRKIRSDDDANDSAVVVKVDELIVPASSESHAVAVHLLASLADAPGRPFAVTGLPVLVAIELDLVSPATEVSEDRGFMIQRHNLSLELWRRAVDDDKTVFWNTDGF